MCPVLCSGNGKYTNGQCFCDNGWYGSECSTEIGQCEVPDCSGNGDCISGKWYDWFELSSSSLKFFISIHYSICKSGFTGLACEQATCSNPNCTGNGICIGNRCTCFSSFTGEDCEIKISTSDKICSNNGYFDYMLRMCVCKNGWNGLTCATDNQNCMDQSCRTCKQGWSGLNCQVVGVQECDSRCSMHGVCANGTCKCSYGYQGRNCQTRNFCFWLFCCNESFSFYIHFFFNISTFQIEQLVVRKTAVQMELAKNSATSTSAYVDTAGSGRHAIWQQSSYAMMTSTTTRVFDKQHNYLVTIFNLK